MPPIYITEQNTKIRIRNNCIHVERETGQDPEMLYQAPISTVSQLVLSGNIGLTTSAIGTFLSRQIDVVFLDSHGNFRSRLLSEANPHTVLRRAQFHAAEDKKFPVNLARCLIRAKLKHQHTILQRQNRTVQDPEIAAAVLEIAAIEKGLEGKFTLPALRGAEGNAAAVYFSGFRKLFAPEWNFRHRRQHPSTDPVNGMLSYGYTLLSQAASAAVQIVGLDPYVGFLHEDAYNRPSLALDLMEEFRPVVDGLVLWCCHSGLITPADFERDLEGHQCLINASARKLLIKTFEERMENRHIHPVTLTSLTLRQCMLEQARQIALCCENLTKTPEFKGMGFR